MHQAERVQVAHGQGQLQQARVDALQENVTKDMGTHIAFFYMYIT